MLQLSPLLCWQSAVCRLVTALSAANGAQKQSPATFADRAAAQLQRTDDFGADLSDARIDPPRSFAGRVVQADLSWQQ